MSTCAPWQGTIRIIIAASQEDQRLQAVREAVAFWNTDLEKLGISLRLRGSETVTLAGINQQLIEMSAGKLKHDTPLAYPLFMEDIDADVLIILTDLNLVSFTEHWKERGKALVAIKSDHMPPLSMPNVCRNVIAHELGHVIGLEHNRNPSSLMCGRPAACRPENFSSPAPRFYPITEEEQERLRTVYAVPGETPFPPAK